jgi:NAD+ kinase
MKVYLIGRNFSRIQSILRQNGIEFADSPEQADLLITHGGDGALLGADQRFPDKRKFPIRDAETAPLCPIHGLEKQIDWLVQNKLSISTLPRLTCLFNGKPAPLKALNDIFIHNSNRVMAMRYKVWIDGELYGHEIVGDGVGVSTVHGSTAYYRSITHSTFRTGIGLAFSNSTELVNHIVLHERSRVNIKILRGPCEMVADNSPDRVFMQEGDEAQIMLSNEFAEIAGLNIFMCPECRMLRHTLRNSTQYA